MDTNFRFSNLIGSVYRNGNVLFSPDGYSVISPVGNKISIFNLKNNISRTLNVESLYNIEAMAINKEGTHLLTANEAGHVQYINLITETILFHFPTNSKVRCLSFSPDSRFVSICRGNTLQLHEILHHEHEDGENEWAETFLPFALTCNFHAATDILTTVEWSDDSRLLVAGGDDKIVRIYSAKKLENMRSHCLSLGSHKGRIVTARFLHNSYDLISVDSTGFCQFWTCSHQPGELVLLENKENAFTDNNLLNIDQEQLEETKETAEKKLWFNKTKRFSVIEASGAAKQNRVTSANFHPQSNILVTAFANGTFVLHEIPSFSLIHNLRVSEMSVQTAIFNATGDWIALGCGKGSAAQLVVWEWQSETYVLKQQAHSQRIITAEFSPDGSLLATGAEDGKVKIWNGRTAFSTVTFDEHTSSVTAVCWTQSGKAILSASLDGTVRAHDLKRYRNFRTLVCPEPTQLGSLAVDKAGDIVCAGAKEVFSIFIWNMENGRLLDVLAGHHSLITSVALFGNKLASSSWDGSVKIWNIVDSSCESQELTQEALSVRFSPCGTFFAVLTMDSVVSFYGTDDLSFIGSIEAGLDLDSGRGDFEVIKRDKLNKNRAFTQMQFSPDGSMIILGGDSNNVCLYSVPDKMLVKKFTLTANRSFDGVVLDINRRNFSEFGNMKLIDTSDSEEEPDHKRQIKLAGSKHMDLGERRAKPEIAVFCLCYCPSGRRFAVCSTEGVGVYSLDVAGLFDPFRLDSDTSPEKIKTFLSMHDYGSAIMASLRLNDSDLIQNSIESTPVEQIALIARSLPLIYAERILKWICEGQVVWNSPNIHFYMILVRSLLHSHGMNLKGSADVAILTGIQQIINHHNQLISKLADQNKYGLRYLLAARSSGKKMETSESS